MFDKCSKTISDSLVRAGVIERKDQNIYSYGIQQGIVSLLNIITTLVIGAIVHAFYQSIVFIVAYIPLRHFAGGYHAKTQFRCYVFSIFYVSSLLLAITKLYVSDLTQAIMFIISSIIIICISPVEACTKPLDSIEVKLYKNRACFIWMCEALVSIFSKLLHLEAISISIIWIFSFLSFMLLLGKIHSKVLAKGAS